MHKTRVNWQFNTGWRIQRTFRSWRAALRYAKHVKRGWHIKNVRMKRI